MSDSNVEQIGGQGISAQLVPLALLGIAALVCAWMVPAKAFALLLGAGGAGFLLVAIACWTLARLGSDDDVSHAVELSDTFASVITTLDSRVLASNEAANSMGLLRGQRLSDTLEARVAAPSQLVQGLIRTARQSGADFADVREAGAALRISCKALAGQRLLWRLEEFPELARAPSIGSDAGVASLVVGQSGTILYMSDAAKALVGRRPKTVDELFLKPPIHLDHIQAVTTETGDINCLVKELSLSSGRQELELITVEQNKLSLADDSDIFEELPVPLLKLTPDGAVLNSNKMARSLLGTETVDGQGLESLLEGLGRSISDWLRDMALGRASRRSEFLKVRHSAVDTFVQVTLKSAVENGKSVLVAVLNDATELKTLEIQFVQSQKMQAIGQLAGGVAHDFNNLLTAISGHCDLLMLRHNEADPNYADLEQINQNANRAAALVGQLLAFSRKQTLRPELLNLSDTLADLTFLLNRLVGETVTLQLDRPSLAPWVRADKRQFEQVIMNLVVNARDAMPTGGEINIETCVENLRDPVQRDRVEVPAGEYAVVRVRDEGVGIPEERIQKIFEPFYTTKRTGEGTGLGLSTAYGIVKQTGGFIFADSVVGKGSCFTLMLPSYHAEDEAEVHPELNAAQEEAAALEETRVVLVVEDEAPVRAFAVRALKLKGYDVLEAASGEEALELLTNKALHVDVFVSDVIMPGLTGPEWVERALLERPEASVIFMSGYAEDAFEKKGQAMDGAQYLQKPFSLKQLAEIVSSEIAHS